MEWVEFWRSCDLDQLMLEMLIATNVLPALLGLAVAYIRRIINKHQEDK